MKSVAEKLGIKPGPGGVVLGAPENMAEIIGLPWEPPTEDQMVVLVFTADRAAVADVTPRALSIYKRGAALWFAYPKKSGAVKSDLSRDAGWDSITAAGLIPVAQIALDGDWSALRFRYRDEVKNITRKEA